jgi:hypothetical protein
VSDNPSFIKHVEQRFARTAAILDFDEPARRVLHALINLDLTGADKPDLHGRQGIISWHRMAEEFSGGALSVSVMEAGVIELADWGLVQVVGRTPADPKLTGTSALRLTHAGRVCAGLAPYGKPANIELADDALPWTVLHHANREGLILEASELIGDAAWHPIVPGTDRNQISVTCGAVAMALVLEGGAVVDGFPLSEGDRNRDLPELLWRTRKALRPRVLLLPEPTSVRAAAVGTGARVHWVEPHLEHRRDDATMDARVTDRLIEASQPANPVAAACGVPKSTLAKPRRVSVAFEDLIVPDGVRTQIDQAVQHAMYRLHVLPEKSRFVGKGGGFRLLLSGLPGTGKSLMAEALATKLDRTVVKLDLSTVLSKWLGETEQLIGQVFDLAEAADAVLVLDEAEALFRQRNSGGGGGGGSNAMLTAVAYLLTRLDRFNGVLVATTNRTQDIDDALYRRFDDFIILPVPDFNTRVRLWKKMLGDGLDAGERITDPEYEILGRHFVITGGLIRGAAIRAGAWASGHNDSLRMPYVLASLARELEKSDHPTTGVLTEPYRTEVANLLNDDRYPASV